MSKDILKLLPLFERGTLRGEKLARLQEAAREYRAKKIRAEGERFAPRNNEEALFLSAAMA